MPTPGAPVIDIKTNTVNPEVTTLLEIQAPTIANLLAQADVDISLYLPGSAGSGTVPAAAGTFHAPVTVEPGQGQTQEPIQVAPLRLDSTQGTYPYVIEVRLSNPQRC